jgi:hypothetical protein
VPAEGLNWLSSPNLLTDDEVTRLITIAVMSVSRSCKVLEAGNRADDQGRLQLLTNLFGKYTN